ncbi:MAG TPA: hypothetical protein VFZ90_01940 [Gemmatimonadales bacterium]
MPYFLFALFYHFSYLAHIDARERTSIRKLTRKTISGLPGAQLLAQLLLFLFGRAVTGAEQ